MKRLLLTGSNGVLGTKLLADLSSEYDVLATSTGRDQNHTLVNHNYQTLDITHEDRVKEIIKAFSPEIIIHTAAYTNVDGAEREREKCYQVNVEGTRFLAEAAVECDAKLVFLSTDYVFDGESGPYLEEDSPHPVGWYGQTKYEAERIVSALLSTALICRTTVLYGIAPHLRTTFVPWLVRELGSGKAVNIVTDQWNNPTLAEDLSGMIGALIQSDQSGLFNTMGASYLSRLDFAVEIADYFSLPKYLVQPITTDSLHQAARRPLKGGGKIDKLMKSTGYQPMTVGQQLELIRPQLIRAGILS